MKINVLNSLYFLFAILLLFPRENATAGGDDEKEVANVLNGLVSSVASASDALSAVSAATDSPSIANCLADQPVSSTSSQNAYEELLNLYNLQDLFKCEQGQLDAIIEYWKGDDQNPNLTNGWKTRLVATKDQEPLLITPEKPLVVVGDTHGDLNALMAPLIKNGFAKIGDPPFKFVSVDGKEVPPGSYADIAKEPNIIGKYLKIPNLILTQNPSKEILFLGDTIDRGTHDAESLYLLNDLLRKQQSMGQNAINYVIGNHEHILMGGVGAPRYETPAKNTTKASLDSARSVMGDLMKHGLAKISYQKAGMHFSHSFLSQEFVVGLMTKKPSLVDAILVLNRLPPEDDDGRRTEALERVSSFLNESFQKIIQTDPDFATNAAHDWLLGEKSPIWCRCQKVDETYASPIGGISMGAGHTVAHQIGANFRDSEPPHTVYSNIFAFDIGQSVGYGGKPGYGVFTSTGFAEERMVDVPPPGRDIPACF